MKENGIVSGQLSRSEWVVMNAVWRLTKANRNVTVSEVMADLGQKLDWHVSTLKTTMERLVKKGILVSTVRGKTCFYEPAGAQEAIVKGNLAGLLDGILEGAFGPLVAYLADKKKLSPKEITALEKILKENTK